MADIKNETITYETGDAPAGRVMPFSEVAEEFEVADGYPDVRGWDVRDSAGRSIGFVYDLLVDVDAGRARFLDVQLEPEFAADAVDPRVLVPLETVDLDPGADEARLGIAAAEVHALVPFARRGVAREAEVPLAAAPAPVDLSPPSPLSVESERPRERHYDDERLFAHGTSSVPRPTDVSMPLAAAPLGDAVPFAGAAAPFTAADIAIPAHDVALPADASLEETDLALAALSVRKTVDTQHVEERVGVQREDVDIERRPLRPGEQLHKTEVVGDEIRIPIMAEELVVERRMVTKEVLIIRKRRHTEERTIEAELRREDVQIGDARTGTSATDTSHAGTLSGEDPIDRVRTLGDSAGGAEGRA